VASNRVNLKKTLTWFAIGFGSGLSPLIPGTAGSLLASLIFYFLIVPFLRPFAYIFILCIYVFLVVTSFFFGLYLYKKTMSNEKDAKIFVWDEFVGMWVACLPLSYIESSFLWLLISFFLFRLFDIWKPLGIRTFDKGHGAFNVMIDDVIAGVYSAVSMIFLFTFFNYI